MLRFAIPGSLLAIALGAALAQPPAWGNISYNTRVSQAASQLFFQVEQLKVFAATVQHPQASQLRQMVNQYYEEILGFARFVQRSPQRPQIEQQFRRIEQRGGQVVTALRAFSNSPQSPQLLQLAARVEFADQRLAAAVLGGGPNPVPGNNLVRLTRAFDTQATYLLQVARRTLKEDPVSQRLERDIRGFSRTVDQFRRVAETNATGPTLQQGFASVQTAWTVVTQNLTSHNFLWESTELRQAVVQVSGLVRSLGDLVGNGAPLPGPGPAPWPPINPGRQRGIYAVGADAGGGPRVRVFHSARGTEFADFMAYSQDFRGGVRVAVGDVDGDGALDVICAPGPGAPSQVRIFSGRDMSLIREFLAFDGNYQQGVWVAAGDFTRNGRTEVVCGADRGGLPIVRVFDAVTAQRLAEFAAYEAPFRGGVRVAVGDINGDGVPDIVTAPGPGRQALIRVFDGRNPNNVISQFDAYAPGWGGGAFVATADINANRRSEILTGADAGGGPNAKLFNGLTGQLLFDFFPFDRNFPGGVRVACRDVNRDGVPDFICASGPGMPTTVRIFNGQGGQLLNEFRAFEPWWQGGAFVGSR